MNYILICIVMQLKFRSNEVLSFEFILNLVILNLESV